MTIGTGKKLDNPLKNPLENPNLSPQQGLGNEPGGIEFESPSEGFNPNPDRNPTKEKGPVELPAKEKGKEEILESPSEGPKKKTA